LPNAASPGTLAHMTFNHHPDECGCSCRLFGRLSTLFPGESVHLVGVNSDYEAALNLVDVIDAYDGRPGIILVHISALGAHTAPSCILAGRVPAQQRLIHSGPPASGERGAAGGGRAQEEVGERPPVRVAEARQQGAPRRRVGNSGEGRWPGAPSLRPGGPAAGPGTRCPGGAHGLTARTATVGADRHLHDDRRVRGVAARKNTRADAGARGLRDPEHRPAHGPQRGAPAARHQHAVPLLRLPPAPRRHARVRNAAPRLARGGGRATDAAGDLLGGLVREPQDECAARRGGLPRRRLASHPDRRTAPDAAPLLPAPQRHPRQQGSGPARPPAAAGRARLRPRGAHRSPSRSGRPALGRTGCWRSFSRAPRPPRPWHCVRACASSSSTRSDEPAARPRAARRAQPRALYLHVSDSPPPVHPCCSALHLALSLPQPAAPTPGPGPRPARVPRLRELSPLHSRRCKLPERLLVLLVIRPLFAGIRSRPSAPRRFGRAAAR